MISVTEYELEISEIAKFEVDMIAKIVLHPNASANFFFSNT